jgi:hypothetical protein
LEVAAGHASLVFDDSGAILAHMSANADEKAGQMFCLSA